jgi:acyl-coenzyme A thioesterase PaaI-like protein
MADHLPLHVIRCPPDDVFRIAEAHTDGRVVSASMPLGDWSVEADGVLAPGSLGVLIDSVLGYASMTTTPGRWSMTTAMTLDVFPALQHAGDCLHAEAQVAEADGFSASRSAGCDRPAGSSSRRARNASGSSTGYRRTSRPNPDRPLPISCVPPA